MIRTLKWDEPLPQSEPRRYSNGDGYVRLRWLVGVQEYVEEYEHRVVAGRPHPGLDVHHRDGDRGNNEASNLQVMTGTEHDALHAARRRGTGAYGEFRSAEERDRALRERDRRSRMAERRERMLAMRASGARLVDIGAAFGLHNSGVSRWLRNVPR